MLDNETKRRIDTARDILVGKVPDPKSQVEQITIALIYKFMDDMDAESEELGGKRSFFTGKFARYGWDSLMHSGLGGHEMLNLYSEGISRMPENPGIPPLFRDIFKNAYLPYRDPETLRAFLKIIDDFTYDHSERLGDAFEYLLSVLGSQGDAGQFRTPRHIIDFMVEIINPQKGDKILDPACGTAGFLISSYKHILRNNADKKGHSTLTPDEKGRLAKNFTGYDISPDMVRLSLVNLYLHGFAEPHIYEYDTLTSQDRWNEYADVILANPPFMSPKGGIKPHSRFSVQSKRSEVLFVDYMAEHLTPAGRAAIIVPEGIIFQSQKAYKQLRESLVNEYLVAVISLPAGVFQPYAGVKTSILIMDKALAKKSDSIAFFKVEKDGFSLSAQRRPIDKNDLPQAHVELSDYLDHLRTEKPMNNLNLTLGLIVPKEKIAANGEYNLSSERYRENSIREHIYPPVTLGEACKINPMKSEVQSLAPETVVSFVPMADLSENHLNFTPKETRRISELGASYTYFADGDVLLAKVTPCFENGKAGIARSLVNGIGFGSSEFYVLRPTERVLSDYIYFCVTSKSFRESAISQMTGTGGLQRVPKSYVENFLIPLPPLEVQKEIVAEIESYQKVIDGARAVIDNYRPHIPIDPEWPMVELGNVCEAIVTGPFGSALHQCDYVNDGIPVINPANIIDGTIRTDGVKMVSPATRDRLKEFAVRPGDIVIGRRGEMGRCGVVTSEMNGWLCGTGSFVIRLKDQCLTSFAFFQITSSKVKRYLEEQAIGVTMKNLNQGILSAIQIQIPPLDKQYAITAEIEAEQTLVNANRELITRMEKKIQATLDRIWGDSQAKD